MENHFVEPVLEEGAEAAVEGDDLDNSVQELLAESSSSDSGREAERESPEPGQLRGRKRKLSPPPSPSTSPPVCVLGNPMACPESCPLSSTHAEAITKFLATDPDEPLDLDAALDEPLPQRQRLSEAFDRDEFFALLEETSEDSEDEASDSPSSPPGTEEKPAVNDTNGKDAF